VKERENFKDMGLEGGKKLTETQQKLNGSVYTNFIWFFRDNCQAVINKVKNLRAV
jgi:hypothetical protein